MVHFTPAVFALVLRFLTRSKVKIPASAQAVYCYSCGAVKGYFIEKSKELLLPTGDRIRFPFTIHCPCGKSVAWRRRHPVAWGEIIDRSKSNRENPETEDK